MRTSLPATFLCLLAAVSTPACGSTGDDLAGASKPADTGTDAGVDVADDASVEDASPPDASGDAHHDTTLPDSEPDTLPPACAAPSDPSTAALCLVIEPEVLDLVDGDERFDGQGVFVVQVFDTPEPDLPDGTQVPALAETTIPDQPGGPTPVLTGVYDPLEPVRFEGLPAQVFVRVLFADNFEVFESDALVGGLFVGGWDLSQGVLFEGGLEPVDLTVGEGLEVTMPLVALRSMKVKLTKPIFVQPRGNGEGPAGFFLFDTSNVTVNAPIWGIGETACGSIHAPSGIDVEGAFVGPGPYFGFGYLDDYGEGIENQIPPGTMVNLELAGGQPSLPAGAEIEIPPGAYRVEASLELTTTIPFQGLPPPDPVSCP